MKRYQSHKVVEAFKITGFNISEAKTERLYYGNNYVEENMGWSEHHCPDAFPVGGYYVKYSDGYTSWSPADAFESGYTEISQGDTMLNAADEAAQADAETRLLLNRVGQFFAYKHLPPHLQAVSKIFFDAAVQVMNLPDNAERTTALRKLLEAKDCAVRAMLYKEPSLE